MGTEMESGNGNGKQEQELTKFPANDQFASCFLTTSSYTVLLNYNFILTRVSTSGATKYFACQMPNFPVEIFISTRRDVVFRRGIYTRRDVAFIHATES